eukprot:scaffold194927_cov41-Prasinocladus_malaysianus.AAC.1
MTNETVHSGRPQTDYCKLTPDAGFGDALLMGRIAGVLWERDGATAHTRSLVDEVDFFRDFGMHVFMIGAEPPAPGKHQPKAKLGPVLRLDAYSYFSECAGNLLLK